MKRVLDILISLIVLIWTWPFFLLAAIGIALTSPGSIFYRAKRSGIQGSSFTMLKFRTMHVAKGGPVITGSNDPRIFKFGQLLRRLKIDELPQFLNVLNGDMSIVGPRPEDPGIVERAYTPWMHDTLSVRPGITSPGALYYYAFGETLVSDEDPEESYIQYLLPPKLAIDLAYISRSNSLTDIIEMFKTAWAVIGYVIGFKVTPSRRDIEKAETWAKIPSFEAAS